jgi:DNA-binding LacI/PurR family transcriptional regulator
MARSRKHARVGLPHPPISRSWASATSNSPSTFPALSTVRVDRAAIGRYAAELILARIDGDTSPKVVDVGFEIVDRATT